MCRATELKGTYEPTIDMEWEHNKNDAYLAGIHVCPSSLLYTHADQRTTDAPG